MFYFKTLFKLLQLQRFSKFLNFSLISAAIIFRIVKAIYKIMCNVFGAHVHTNTHTHTHTR